MGVAEAAGLDPANVLVQALVETLHERAQGVAWRSTPEGLVADIAEGELLLSPVPGPTAVWRLSVVFRAAPTAGAGPEEQGSRVVAWGTLGHMHQRALDLAMYGVPGGATFDHAAMVWRRTRDDDSLRMTVPGGELRISTVDGELCTLTHDDEHGVELLSLGTAAALERQGLPMCLTRATRPLQIRVHGRCVNLRSIGVAGVLGYHVLEDRSFVALALVRGGILLLHVRGGFHRVVARLSWADVMFGEPVEVQPLSPVTPASGIGIPRAEPYGEFTAGAAVNVASGKHAPADQTPHDMNSPPSPPRPPPTPPPEKTCTTHTPMADRHRELCRRHFQRLHARLAGRGARKARLLVLILLDALDKLRENITGSRLEIHARLVEVLDRPMPGGHRNIRDCLDLLIRTSPVARAEAGKRCTLRFAELHDPDSELMRLIASEDALEEPAANARPSTFTLEPGPDDAGSAVTATITSPVVEPPDETVEVATQPATQQTSGLQLSTTPSSERPSPDSGEDPSSVEVFRRLGRPPEQPPALEAAPPVESCERATPPSVAATRSPPPGFGLGGSTPPRQLLRSFFRRGSYFLGEFVPDDNNDDDDDAPSRFRGVTETAQPGAPPGPVRPESDEVP